MTVASADYTTLVAAGRRCLANGTSLTGAELRLMIDVVQAAANTLDSKGITEVGTVNTLADALEALLVTHFGILVADGVAPTEAHVTAMVDACATPRTDLIAAVTAAIAADAVTITNVAADDSLDGRSA